MNNYLQKASKIFDVYNDFTLHTISITEASGCWPRKFAMIHASM